MPQRMSCKASANFLSVLLNTKKGTSQKLCKGALQSQVRAASLWVCASSMQLHLSSDLMPHNGICADITHRNALCRDIMYHGRDIMHSQCHSHVQRVVMMHHQHYPFHLPKNTMHNQHQQHLYTGIMHHRHVQRHVTGCYNQNLHTIIAVDRDNGAHRSLHSVASQEGTGDDSKQTGNDVVWEDLESKMQVIRGGIAKGEALEALKSSVDYLLPTAAPDNFQIGEACLALAQSYACSDEDPKKFLDYAKRALQVYESLKESSDLARSLYLLGYAYFKMEEYQKAVVHFEDCSSLLTYLTEIGCDNEYCDGLKPEVQAFLGRSKMLLLRSSEAIIHYRNFVHLKEKYLEPGHPELGTCYLQAARGFRGLKDMDMAMCISSKSLEIFTKCFGPNSLQVGEVRSLLAGLHCDLGRYEDSLTECQTARPILEQNGDLEEVAYVDFTIAEALTQLGRHPEAISKLEEVIKGTELTSAVHFNALLTAARACASTKRNECVADYCTKALNVLQQQEASADTALSLALLALVYEEQKEYMQALSVLRNAKGILDKLGLRSQDVPAFAAADIDGKLGFLLLRVRRANEAIPYLENTLLKDRKIHDRELLYVQFNLGAAYLQVRRFQDAIQQIDSARMILSGGFTGLDASKRATMFRNIASLYKSCRRHREAIECENAAAAILKENEAQKVNSSPARTGVL